ncbi:MAG: glycosyltransferase family 2 protein [Firmicutes bacterium]|nr:glycosyltransferase family 2 protein [Bacillota bacterium]
MYKGHSITVIIPTMNEEAGIARVLDEIPGYVDEVMVVDSSSDRTAEIAKSKNAKVVREERRGYGRAYKTGFENSTSEYITTIDGDGTYPVYQIAEMLDFAAGNNIDFLSGSRFPLKVPDSMKAVNLIGNKLLTWAFNVLYFKNVRDILTGMWLIKRDIIPYLNITSDDWNFSEEIKIEAIKAKNIKFAEFCIDYHRGEGRNIQACRNCI